MGTIRQHTNEAEKIIVGAGGQSGVEASKNTDPTAAASAQADNIDGLHDTGGYPGLSATIEESLVAATITQSVDRLNKVSPESLKKSRLKTISDIQWRWITNTPGQPDNQPRNF
jgi:hypothetical protein